MSNGGPQFAFAFRDGSWQAPSNFVEVDAAAANADFLWVHLDLGDAAAQAWLRARPWPADVIEVVAAPIQRGKLFITSELIYGHLRDFRYAPGATGLQAGSLSVVVSQRLLVTGRRIPLRSIEELRRRVESQTVRPASPYDLITEFFKALNDIGEDLLQKAAEQLRSMESKVLKRVGGEHREEILEMRRDSIEIVRDMTFKRTALLDWVREQPSTLPADEYERLNHQIHRYAALVEDAQEFADQCQFVLEELRAQVEEKTNRNLYILTAFSAIFLPATLVASIWGMNVGGLPFGDSPHGFLVVGGLIAVTCITVVLLLFRFKFF
jgi:zinc transporter